MLKVLVVDDEAPIRQWLEYCVDKFDGFTVAGAAVSGDQGLELYRRELPDIVVTDIEMPGMDGLEMLRRMQKIHSAYMIILTSHEDFSYARQALSQGTAEYILKAEITMGSFQKALKKRRKVSGRRGFPGRRAWSRRPDAFCGSWRRRAAGRRLRRKCCAGRESPWRTGRFAGGGYPVPGRGPNCPVGPAPSWPLEAPGLDNLCLLSRDDEQLLVMANLRQEGAAQMAAKYLEKKNQPSFTAGISDPVQGIQKLPEALRTAQARCCLHFYHPGRHVFWKETVHVEVPRRAEIWRASFSKALFGQNYQEGRGD